MVAFNVLIKFLSILHLVTITGGISSNVFLSRSTITVPSWGSNFFLYPQNIAEWIVSEAEEINKQQVRANNIIIIIMVVVLYSTKKSERGTRMTWLNFGKFVLKVC